jgi:hypothetical protein
LKFLVFHEPIWRFSDQIALAEPSESGGLQEPGDAMVLPCDEGLTIFNAVEEFDDIEAALTEHREAWLHNAVKALKRHFRDATPTGVLRLYRDPVDGTLKNLAD